MSIVDQRRAWWLMVAVAGSMSCVGAPPGPPQGEQTDGATGAVVTTTDGTGTGPEPTTGDETRGCVPGLEGCGDSTSGSDGGSTSTDGGDSTTVGSSTGPLGNPYAGSYHGTWEGMCASFPNVNGELMFDVDDEGILMGTMSGTVNGSLDGNVDDTGAVMSTAMIGAGRCSFVGQIDDAGGIDGTWECSGVMCSGTWNGSQVG